ncbi:hypothetical protein EGW08_010324, partial [Elysia chlorotica]
LCFILQTKASLPVTKIQSVKAVRKGIRDIPRAFEIFTGDQTYMFKAKSHQSVEQWVQCLHIAVARSHGSGGTGSVAGSSMGADPDRASRAEEAHGARRRLSIAQERGMEGASNKDDGRIDTSFSEERRSSHGSKGQDSATGSRLEVMEVNAASSGGASVFGGVEERRSRRGGRRFVASSSGGKAVGSQDEENSLSGYSTSLSKDEGVSTASGGGGGGGLISSEEFFRRSSIRRSSGAGSVGGRSLGSSMVRGHHRSSDRSARTFVVGVQQQDGSSFQSASPHTSSVGINGGGVAIKTVTDTKL